MGPERSTEKPPAKAPRPETHLRALLILFFLSGFASLVYEIAWGRSLTLVMGGTVYAVSVILASFMGGLALGSYCLGRLADRIRRPLLVYSMLEFAMGAYGLAVPFLSSRLDAVYVPLAGGLSSRLAVTAARAFVSFLFLLLPTFLMGATFPVVVRYLTRSLSRLGGTVGKLYASNTLGGAAGAFAAGMILIERLGFTGTVVTAALLNLIAGAGALVLSRRALQHHAAGRAPQQHAAGRAPSSAPGELWRTPALRSLGEGGRALPARKAEAEEAAAPALRPTGVARPVLLVVVALSGFCSLGYEVLWTRMLVFLLGNSTWAFAAMLVAFLAGIALGSAVISRYADRAANLVLLIAAVEASAAAATLLMVPVHARLYLVKGLVVRAAGTVNGLLAALLLVSFLAMILPTTLLGMVLPAMAKAYTRSIDAVGRGIGSLYALNTLGAILGSLLPAFLLIPLLGLKGALVLVAALNAAAGAVLLLPATGLSRAVRLSFFAFPAVILLAGALLLPADLAMRGPLPGQERIFRHESVGGVVEVFRTEDGEARTMMINGVPEVPTDRTSMRAFRLLALLPVLAHPAPRRALVVTFGGGIVAGTLGRCDLESVDCVEIFPGIREAAPFFRAENHAVLENPLVNLVIEDGRNFLLTAGRKYDIITADATHPTAADSWVLYTREYYELCKERLAPDGVLVQWVPLHGFSFAGYCTILKTMREVFPHVEIWFAGMDERWGHTVVMASRRPVVLDYGRLGEELETPAIREDLGELGLDDPPALIALRLTDERGIDRMVKHAPVNTDDRPVITFPDTLPREGDTFENLRRMLGFVVPPRLENVPPGKEAGLLKSLAALPHRYRGEVLAYSGEPEKALEELQRALGVNPSDGRAYELILALEGGRARATMLDAARGRAPERLFAEGFLAFSRGDLGRARELFARSIEEGASFPEPHCYLGLTLAGMGEQEKAKKHLRKALELWPEMGLARRGLADLARPRGGPSDIPAKNGQ
jgi:spermidine synthase